jgi:hypothetical protein
MVQQELMMVENGMNQTVFLFDRTVDILFFNLNEPCSVITKTYLSIFVSPCSSQFGEFGSAYP